MTSAGDPAPEDAGPLPCPECGTLDISEQVDPRCVSCGAPLPSAEPATAGIARLYREQHAPLLRFAVRLGYRYSLPDPGRDAEDVVQVAFAAAFEQWSTLRNPAAWLYTVVRNQMARAAAEAHRHEVEVLDEDAQLEPAADGVRWSSMARRPNPHDVLLARQAVTAILEIDSDRQRIATYLRHVEQWSPEEIAELLDCAPGTIWAHTARGLDRVRQQMYQQERQRLSHPQRQARALPALQRWRVRSRRQRALMGALALAALALAVALGGALIDWLGIPLTAVLPVLMVVGGVIALPGILFLGYLLVIAVRIRVGAFRARMDRRRLK